MKIPMSKILKRKFSTALRVLQNGGPGPLLAAAGRSFERQKANRQSKRNESVDLDGCTFTLKGISSVSMRRALLNREYESFERRAAITHVSPEYPVIELGACIGVVACVTNRIISDPTSHVVVEANPSVIQVLEENKRRNHCKFEILNRAIAYSGPSVTFAETTDYWGNSLQRDSSEAVVTVKTTSLGQIVAERGYGAYTLICDIEGHEYDLVRHEADALRGAQTIILETHARMIGEAKTLKLLESLRIMGFDETERDSFVYVLRRPPAMTQPHDLHSSEKSSSRYARE